MLNSSRPIRPHFLLSAYITTIKILMLELVILFLADRPAETADTNCTALEHSVFVKAGMAIMYIEVLLLKLPSELSKVVLKTTVGQY